MTERPDAAPREPATPEPARSFGVVAEAYHRGRPTYPDKAVAWLTGDRPLTVLELGAGTGKLTAQLVAAGHDVHATDPDAAMLEVLRRELPSVRTSACSAEEVPAADHAYDVVVAAQSFHWFDPEVALPEIQRVLKPSGRFSLVWNIRDERIPWVRKLGRLIGTQDNSGSVSALDGSLKFIMMESEEFSHWQVVDRRSIQDLARSRSNLAVLDDDEREAKIDEVLAFYDDYGRGMDGMQLPYVTKCFRARVVKRRETPAPARTTERPSLITSTTSAPITTVGEAPDVAFSPAPSVATLTEQRPSDAPTEEPTDREVAAPSDPDQTEEISLVRDADIEPPTDDDGVLLIDFR